MSNLFAIKIFSANFSKITVKFSLPHRRRRVFSSFDCRSSFSRFSDFIEASARKKTENEKKTERKKRTVRFQLQEGRGRTFNHAPRAGKELTAGGSRTHTSMADATRNVPSAISKLGSRAVAIELCRATERRLHQRRWNASCIERRRTAGSEAARWRARAVPSGCSNHFSLADQN